MAARILKWRIISFDVGIRNFAICILHAFKHTNQLQVAHYEVIDILKENNILLKNANKAPAATLRSTLLKTLESRETAFIPSSPDLQYEYLPPPTFVAVEMQTKQRFTTMAATIYDWFHFKHDIEPTYVHGSRKLKVYGRGATGTYKTNKERGIAGCCRFLKEHADLNQPFHDWWIQLKKKDDISDSVLQALWLHYQMDPSRSPPPPPMSPPNGVESVPNLNI